MTMGGDIGPSKLLAKQPHETPHLTFGVGGEGIDDSDDWEDFLDEIEDEDAVLFDVKGAENGAPNMFPPDPPEVHDPDIAVYGIEPGRLQELLDSYEGVLFDDVVETVDDVVDSTTHETVEGVEETEDALNRALAEKLDEMNDGMFSKDDLGDAAQEVIEEYEGERNVE